MKTTFMKFVFFVVNQTLVVVDQLAVLCLHCHIQMIIMHLGQPKEDLLSLMSVERFLRLLCHSPSPLLIVVPGHATAW